MAKLTDEQKGGASGEAPADERAQGGDKGASRRGEAPREWQEKGMYLTRVQAAAGELCRGCGLPVIDNLGNWPGTMYLTPEQQVEYDADQGLYK